MPLPRLLVFDLDGTLVDSQIDLANSINATLRHFHKPELPPATIATYIGDGAATLVRRSLAHVHAIAGQPDPHDDAFVEEAHAWFIAYYRVHKLDFTTMYPGVLDSLTVIRERHPHLQMACLTNKPVDPSRAICAHFGLDRFFFQTCGGNSFATKKPHPEGLLSLIAKASALIQPPSSPSPNSGQSTLTQSGWDLAPITPADTVMIGDSHVDIETARAAGTRSLGCTYGLSPATLAAAVPDLTVDHAADWPAALGL